MAIDLALAPDAHRLEHRDDSRDAHWNRLTASAPKWALYREEPGFVAALARLLARTGPAVVDALQHHAVILMKPEAWIGGTWPTVTAFLERHGFDVVGSFRTEITPIVCREIWRYQWNIAPVDRIEISEIIMSLGPCYGFVLRDRQPTDRSASVRLAQLKGPAKPDRQRAGHLRFELRVPNRIVSYVHIPDESADVIRDLHLLLGRRPMVELLAAVSAGESQFASPADGAPPADVSRLDRDSRVATPLGEPGDTLARRIELIEPQLRACRDDRGTYRIPPMLWRHLLDLCGDIAQLPTLGEKRVQPVADMAS